MNMATRRILTAIIIAAASLLSVSAQEYVLPNDSPNRYLEEPEISKDGFYYYILDSEARELALMGTDPLSLEPMGHTRETMNIIAPFWEGNAYSGDVEVPEKVEFEGEEYTVVRIAFGAFAKCPNLTSIKLPASIRVFGIGAIYDCPALNLLSLDGSIITEWDVECMLGCPELKTIEVRSTNPAAYNGGNFPYETGTLVVPDGCLGIYKAVDPWKNFHNIIENSHSGIGTTMNAQSPIAVSAPGCIRAGAERVTVYNICGSRITDLEPGAAMKVSAGIYIVRSCSGARKLIVR